MQQAEAPEKPTQKFLLLQALRALAVVLVLHLHALESQDFANSVIGKSWQEGFLNLHVFGAVGVDIFFVISGFIIVYTSGRFLKEGAGGQFLLKRFVRIVPLYWLVTALLLLSQWLLQQDLELKGLLKTFTFLPFTDATAFDMPVLAVGWTLSFELFFYSLIALSLKSKSRHYVAWVVLLLLAGVSFGFLFQPKHPLLLFLTNALWYEFVFGCLLGLLYLRFKTLNKTIPGFVPGLLLLLGVSGWLLTLAFGYDTMGLLLPAFTGEAAFGRALLWGLPSAFVVVGCVFFEATNKVRVPSAVLAIGDASFSIYLTHTFPIKAMALIWSYLNAPSPDLYVLVAILISVVFGWVFYVLVEKRVVAWGNSLLSTRPTSKTALTNAVD